MIDSILSAFQPAKSQNKVLVMLENERMGGKIPAWMSPEKAAKLGHKATPSPETQLTNALNNIDPAAGETTLSYVSTNENSAIPHSQEKEFTFGDLLDMINPLHHIPLVNYGYRELTGDEIKPIGKIMGGSLFGGPLGAATGLVDTIITAETGKSMTGHIMTPAFAFGNTSPSAKDENTLLAFSDLSTPEPVEPKSRDPFKSLNA